MTWQAMDAAQKIEAIQRVYEPGISTSQIAKRIRGASRNAIIGVFHRNRGKFEGFPLAKPHLPSIGVATKRRKQRGGTVARARIQPSIPIKLAPIITGAPQTAGRPLMAMGAGQCRFPVNDAARGEEHLFCGAPADGSWCQIHHGIVYRPRRALQEQTGNSPGDN